MMLHLKTSDAIVLRHDGGFSCGLPLYKRRLCVLSLPYASVVVVCFGTGSLP